MNSNNMIINFLNQISIEEKKRYLNNDNLIYLLAEEYKDEFIFDDIARSNMKILFAGFQGVLLKIVTAFEENNISYVMFKGISLACALYDEPYRRSIGDIDIFVEPNIYNRALELLIRMNYKIKYESGIENPHHIVLTNDKVTIELHKNLYHPMIRIDETFLRTNIESCAINNYAIITFNKTASILHLIYHLYMDSCLTYNSLYTLFSKKKFQEVNRFLYRAYEISLFSEKYFKEIKWEDIEKDLKCQKLRIIFKKMISDIIWIFPNAFPESFLRTVFHLEYIDDERDQLYKYLIDSKIKKCDKDIDYILINYINDNWEARREKKICKKVGEIISLPKESSEEKQDLNCVIDTEKTAEGLKVVFKVPNDDFCISETDNYDTQASDGVHLLLCGTEQYSYNSIFFFPKQIDGEIRVVVCDVLNNRNQILTDDLIKAEFSKTENDYTITATLTNKFLKENNLNSYLYMGLVISDCSSETHRRKNQLILSEEDSQWYNPTYFAKIDLL